MNIKIALVAALAAVSLAPAASFASDDHEVHGRSDFALTAALAENGIAAERVEEWGEAIRVDVRQADGSLGVLLVDKDTLQPLSTISAGNRSQLGNTGSGFSATDFTNAPQSLTYSDED
ncbi:hypothetical protein GCM10007989_16460 [Devosia pacifica]|uniref:PepSY domain-containing protein n=1 Tax=Devosia pacifica TaxID=1335967 RepID=A0A918VTP8_9HYPH|nr:hypothetical protein [Devosia pacifica]GHA21834.1 hypothetical protein GCM10007989_16460 [Devosia pacifica]